jgi:hypothetical protein
VVDEKRALAHAVESAILADRHFAQIIIVTDAAEHDLLTLSCFLRCFGSLAAMGFHPFFGLGMGAVIDGDVMALLRQMAGHRASHYAQTEKSDFSHGELLRSGGLRPLFGSGVVQMARQAPFSHIPYPPDRFDDQQIERCSEEINRQVERS